MALKRRTQVAAKVQDQPGVTVTPGSADVMEVLDAEFSEERGLIERNPASQSLSNTKKAVGPGSATATFGVDWRGGRTQGKPDFDPMLLACGFRGADARTLTFDVGGAAIAISRGNILQGAVSGTRFLCVEDAAVAAATVRGVWLTPDVAFSAGESLDNLTTDDTASADYGSDAIIGSTDDTQVYFPASTHYLAMTLASGTWTGTTPGVGDGVGFADSAGNVRGGGIILSLSGTAMVVEMTWGTAAASDAVVSQGLATVAVGTNALSASPAFAQSIWPFITLQQNEHNHVRIMSDTLGKFTVSAEAGGALTANFEFQGKKGNYGEDAFITGATRNTKLPPRMLQTAAGLAEFSVNGIKLPFVSMEIDLGMDLALVRDGNRTEGTYRTEGTARNPKITLTTHRVPIVTYDWEAMWQAGTSNIIALVADGGAANGTMIIAPNAQVANVSHGEQDGLITDTIEFELAGTVDDDELVLFFGTVF